MEEARIVMDLLLWIYCLFGAGYAVAITARLVEMGALSGPIECPAAAILLFICWPLALGVHVALDLGE